MTLHQAGNYMHELKRRAYLEAMGIATYVSRGQRAGSAPTTKLRVVKRSPIRPEISAEPNRLEAAVGSGPGAVQMPRVDVVFQPKSSPASAAPVAHVTSGETTVVEFNITALTAGGWLWLEELPSGQALLRDQVLLVQAMAQALGWGGGKPEISQFKWPIHTNRQLDLGEDAARASLGGFILRKFDQEQCQGLVLLGAACQRWVPLDSLAGVKHRVCAVGTAEMLHNPLLKKQAWRDLLSTVG